MDAKQAKKESLRKQIILAADVYKNELAGKVFLYTYGEEYFEIYFCVESFMYLTWVDFGKKAVKDFQQHILISKREFDDFGGYIAEIWKYDPRFLADGTVVDDLSLFLSLKDDDDERIQKELDGIRTRGMVPLISAGAAYQSASDHQTDEKANDSGDTDKQKRVKIGKSGST